MTSAYEPDFPAFIRQLRLQRIVGAEATHEGLAAAIH